MLHAADFNGDHKTDIALGCANTAAGVLTIPVAFSASGSRRRGTADLQLRGLRPRADDFNPSIAIGMNGASRTIFLNWA